MPSMTGPKILPMKPVPCFCITNSPIRMTMVSGTTAGASEGASTFKPSIALRDRDRRSDRAVAVEQRRADQADDQQLRAPGARLGVARVQQRQQGDDAAFAAVVRTQDQQRVFDRNDQDQRPQDQRHHPEDGVRRDGVAVGGGPGGFFQRVEGAGADIAVHDAKGAKRRGCRQGAGMAGGDRGCAGHWLDPQEKSQRTFRRTSRLSGHP